MGAISKDLREETADDTTCGDHAGVFMVTLVRRRPGAIVMDLVRMLEERVLGLEAGLPLQAIVDVRHSSFSPSGQEIRMGAVRLGRLQNRGKIALLVANDFQFGIGRMFGLLSDSSGFDIRPFRDPTMADEWVREA